MDIPKWNIVTNLSKILESNDPIGILVVSWCPMPLSSKNQIFQNFSSSRIDVSMSVQGQEVEIQALSSSSPMNIYGQGIGDE